MLTIASLTFKEALRKKILVAALVLTLLFLVVYGVGLHFISSELSAQETHWRTSGASFSQVETNMMHETTRKAFLLLGIYFASSIVSLLAIFSAVGSVSSEIENGMLHALLAKPIRRRSVILGKFTGYALMLALYATLLFVSILGLNHFIFKSSLSGTLPAVGLFILEPLVLLAITIAGSTKFSTLANGIIAFMVYTIGVIGGMAEQVGAMAQIKMLVTSGEAISLFMPVDALYRMIAVNITGPSANPLSNFAFGPFGAVSQPSNAMVVYAFLYIAAFVLIAVRAFSKRDLG
ncbi:MAG: ABC transporter permease [Candidatus Aquicultor sp.]